MFGERVEETRPPCPLGDRRGVGEESDDDESDSIIIDTISSESEA